MAMVVKVRFKRASKLYDFDAEGFELHTGMRVVTETARGVELGECMSGVFGMDDELLAAPLKPIIRIATEQDLLTQKSNEASEKEAFDIAMEKIAEHGLEMKLVDVEYAFDRSKIVFYFTANGRVDFRMLVKNLAGIFKTRIELRQIGVRDEAKMLGGIGPCGRPICCRTFLGDFTPVSIKMAKEQNLSLNPTKISGLCDRLMCCLKYEQDHYEVTRKRMPRIGREIITPDGPGTINAINVLEETVRVRIAVGDSFELRVYPIDDCQRPSQERAPLPPRGDKPARRESAPEQPKAAPDETDENAGEAQQPVTAPEEAPQRADGQDAVQTRDARQAQDLSAPQAEQAETPKPRAHRQPTDRPQGDKPRADRPPRGDRPRGERPPKGERAQGERPQRADHPQGDKPRPDRPPRGERPTKGDHPQRGDRPQGERPMKNERAPRAERAQGERPPKDDRPAKSERAPRPDRPQGDRSPRAERPPRPPRAERPPRPQTAPAQDGAGKPAQAPVIDIRETDKAQDLL